MFDLKTVIRDSKTGSVVSRQPYRLHVKSGTKYYERPVGSGNLWFEDGSHAGQIVGSEIKAGAEHANWVPPISKEQRILDEINSKDSKIRALEAQIQEMELKAINDEKEQVVVEKQQPKIKEKK